MTCPARASSLLLAIGLTLLGATTASAAPIWEGDFETGDLSQWGVHPWLVPAPERLTVVQDVVREGEHAARVEIHPEDIVESSGQNRMELCHTPPQEAFEGTERYYAMSLRPGEEPWADSWHLVHYWEGNPFFVQAMGLRVSGQTISFATVVGGEQQHWQGAFTPDQWHDFVFHILWSPDPGVGFVEMWVGGELVLPRTYVATMHSEGGTAYPNFMHVGIIRDPNNPLDEVLYVDGVREGESLEDVLPPEGGGTGGEDTGGADTTGGNEDDSGGPPDSTAGEGPGDPTGAGDGPGTGGADDSGTGSAGSSEGEDGGCGCRSRGGAPPAWWALGLLGLRRRRRSAAGS